MITKRNRQDKLRSDLIKEYNELESFDEFKMVAITKYGCHISKLNLFSLKYHVYSGQWYDLDVFAKIFISLGLVGIIPFVAGAVCMFFAETTTGIFTCLTCICLPIITWITMTVLIILSNKLEDLSEQLKYQSSHKYQYSTY